MHVGGPGVYVVIDASSRRNLHIRPRVQRPKWGPQRETRQTVCERLNDVLGEKPFGFRPFILKYNGISQINGSYGFCQNRFVPR